MPYQRFPCHHKFTGTHINLFWFIRLCEVNSGTLNQSKHNVCWRKIIYSFHLKYSYIFIYVYLHPAPTFIFLLLLSTHSHLILSSLRLVFAYVLLSFSAPLSPSFLPFYYLFKATHLFITELSPLTCRADCRKTSFKLQCAKEREREQEEEKKWQMSYKQQLWSCQSGWMAGVGFPVE